jgi:hypothetical protein
MFSIHVFYDVWLYLNYEGMKVLTQYVTTF